MRAYFFGNLYLSSIQQGIQALHCVTEMYNKYLPSPTSQGECCFTASNQSIILTDWACNHKTSILLNAGYSSNIRDIYTEFADSENPYPWEIFNEGDDALDGALTCAGIILPEEIYETASTIRHVGRQTGRSMAASLNQYGEFEDPDTGTEYNFNKFQVWLINELNKYGLAK